tara:strand:- start:118 stop:309 length:192 start_codon:yes stop_codon:yes gene_type:complete
MDIMSYVPWVLTGAMSIGGYLFKNKYGQFKVIIETFVDMIEDDKVTPEELNTFMNEVKKLIGK